MREEKLLNYLKGACTGRKYERAVLNWKRLLGISGTDLRKLVNRMRRKVFPLGVIDADISTLRLPAKSSPRFSSFRAWKMDLRQQDAD